MTDTTYEQYTGKRVSVVKKGGTAQPDVTVEGRVVQGNSLGVIVRAKGKSTVDLIEASDIISIVEQVEHPKKLSQKKLPIISTVGVRQHLALYHGVSLETVNQDNYTDEAAEAYHDSIDHSQAGHKHEAGKAASGELDSENVNQA